MSARSHPFTLVVRLVDALNKVAFYLIGALLAGMCVLALLQVVVRQVLTTFDINLSVPWSEEVGRYSMIWLIFLGAAYACRAAQMIALTFAVEALPLPWQRYVDALVAVVCIAFYALLVKVGIQAVEFGWIERSPVLQFPKAYVYLAMPVGAVLMIANTIVGLVERGLFRRTYERSGPGNEPATQEPAA